MDQHQSTENNNKDIVKEGQVYNVDLLGIGAQFCEDSKASSLHVNSHQYLYSHPQTYRMIQGMGKLTLWNRSEWSIPSLKTPASQNVAIAEHNENQPSQLEKGQATLYMMQKWRDQTVRDEAWNGMAVPAEECVKQQKGSKGSQR